MGFPEINIIFKSVAESVIKRGNRGIVFAVMRDLTSAKGIYDMTSAADIPSGLSAANRAQLNIHDPVVREETDLDRLGTLIAGKLSQVRGNMGAIPAIA